MLFCILVYSLEEEIFSSKEQGQFIWRFYDWTTGEKRTTRGGFVSTESLKVYVIIFCCTHF